MLKNFYIKSATDKEDAVIISKLADKIWTQYYTPMIGSGQVIYMLKKFQSSDVIYEDIKSAYYKYFIAYENDEPVGYLAVSFDKIKKEIFLSKIYVDKSSRGKGISRKFVDMLKEISRGEYVSVRLTVNKNNKNSIEIYKKLGFVICDTAVTDIGGGFVMDDYIMKMSLSEGLNGPCVTV